MNRTIALYDADSFYAERLAEYINRTDRIPFTAVSFSSIERLKEYLIQHKAELLLIGQDPEELAGEQSQIGQIMILHDGELPAAGVSDPAVYKFQPADNLLREVMALLERKDQECGGCRMGRCTITGIYSPVNRCGKTAFSLTYAHALAKESRTLYLCMEDCSGFSRIFPKEGRGDFSDIIYYFKQRGLDRISLSTAVHKIGEVEYIPPVRYPEDLNEIGVSELTEVIRRLSDIGGYEGLVVDLGSMGRSAASLLEICDMVFMPVLEDFISRGKIAEFEAYLESSQRRFILERIQKIMLPAVKFGGNGGTFTDQLLWGEMGDYVRQLMRGGDKNWHH